MQDLSNARIIEWDYDGETQVGARKARGERFEYAYRGSAHSVSEEEIRAFWKEPPVRVVAEFPAPTLEEMVGDAPAFWFTNTDNIPFIACRAGDWRGPGDDGLWYALPRHRGDRPYMFEAPLHAFKNVLLDSVVPLVPREVAS